MANQYSGSFEQVIQKKFGREAKELLKEFSADGINYYEAEKILGFRHVTIRKWAKRYNIDLSTRSEREFENISIENQTKLVEQCEKSHATKINIFSKKWVNFNLLQLIKDSKVASC